MDDQHVRRKKPEQVVIETAYFEEENSIRGFAMRNERFDDARSTGIVSPVGNRRGLKDDELEKERDTSSPVLLGPELLL
ncbi:hypothetical protein LTR28_005495 [Elasticomyces elasticus]|nr:hypothetical protein LTR28_005495 [Elasticomyces elasticus]